MNNFLLFLIWLNLMWLCNRIYWLTAVIATCKWDSKKECEEATKSWKVM